MDFYLQKCNDFSNFLIDYDKGPSHCAFFFQNLGRYSFEVSDGLALSILKRAYNFEGRMYEYIQKVFTWRPVYGVKVPWLQVMREVQRRTFMNVNGDILSYALDTATGCINFQQKISAGTSWGMSQTKLFVFYNNKSWNFCLKYSSALAWWDFFFENWHKKKMLSFYKYEGPPLPLPHYLW